MMKAIQSYDGKLSQYGASASPGNIDKIDDRDRTTDPYGVEKPIAFDQKKRGRKRDIGSVMEKMNKPADNL